ncbi:MAG: hypothetical protein U9O24_00265 [Campylobacterota bacterium]|nr:hypothetical protein [Campylobacterota bacterium]
MKKLTIKQYAIKHKLSTFNVMKMIKSAKLDVEVSTLDGKEITYILLNEANEKEVKAAIIPVEDKNNFYLEEMVLSLQKEVKSLRNEIEILKNHKALR